jgi:hypothetical protein
MYRAIIFRLTTLLALTGTMAAQEGGGQAEVGFQHYYLSMRSQRVSDVSGLTLNYSQFVPDVGLLSIGLAPAMNNNSFRTGDDYLRLTGLPWKGQYWKAGFGDFYVPGAVVPVSFTNLYFPQIAARGVSLEASHGGRTVGFFYGAGTITNTPRVVLRMAVPQKVAGVYFRQGLGSRLVVGARYLHFANDLDALRRTPYLAAQTVSMTAVGVLSGDILFKIAKPAQWFAEGAWSVASLETPIASVRNVPFSFLTGPVLETEKVTIRANYMFQSAAYFPLLGYYLGDRKGPFGEVRVRPVKRLELYASASRYENNVARDPALATFQSSTISAGSTLQLPGGMNLIGQFTQLNLTTRPEAASAWQQSNNRQKSLMLTRSLHGHSVRVTAREFSLQSGLGAQHQRSESIDDIFHAKGLILGGGIKVQHLNASESRTTMYYHGLAQIQIKRFSAHADIETGRDLENRTLFATNSISTSIIGASLALNRQWDVQAEAYRNNFATVLNPQSIFVLEGQGISVPGTLATLNQWSLYFSINRRFRWGKAGTAPDMTQYAIRQTPLKGGIEGFVREQEGRGDLGVEGITVALDAGRTAVTDPAGHYRFSDVAEGVHRVALSTDELLADFDPGPHQQTSILVGSGKLVRTDLDVIRLATIRGTVSGPPGAELARIVVRLAGTDSYTTPDGSGVFHFYNLHQGEYTVVLDQKTLPSGAKTISPLSASVTLKSSEPPSVHFAFEVHETEKVVRRVFEKTIESPVPDRNLVPVSQPSAPVVIPVPPPKEEDRAAAGKHDQLGRQLTQQGRYQEALAELSEAIRLAPNSATSYNARGFVYYLKRNFSSAIEDLSTAIRLNPNYANAFQIRGLARKAAGDLAGAQADLQRAAQLRR